MKNFMIVLSVLIFSCSATHAQKNWKAEMGQTKGFIENKGQFSVKSPEGFDSQIRFSHDGAAEELYFTRSGLVIDLNTQQKHTKSDSEKKAREEKMAGITNFKDWQTFEKQGKKLDVERDQLFCQWLGANQNVEIIADAKNSFYHSYSFIDENGTEQHVNFIPSYQKLTYKNLYPNVDVVYEFHGTTGVKYSIVVHPGGDISNVKLKYSKNITLQTDGTIHTATKFGDIVDHAPITYYQGEENKIISSSYNVTGNIISFNVGNYNHNKTLIIDPWTQSPAFNTNWDCIWECETDASGNTYIIGGVMPLQLLKYNNAGALQWTYNTPYDTTAWLGTFATDNAGNSYVTNGSVAAIIKVNTAGGLVWNNPSPGGLFASTEFWNIAFNCDQTKLVIGGTGGFLPPLPYIYDVDMNTGNVLSSIQVCGSTISGIPPNTQEVRSITATKDEKYYWLSHDSIGYVNQNLTVCPLQGSSPFHVDNGYDLGYKCENWRYNNTGLEAIAYYNNFIFVHRGNRLDKRNFATGAIMQTVVIPGGVFNSVFLGGNQVGCSGITIDDCGNIYVGSSNGVYKFNQALTQIASYATTFNVYDVAITSTGEIVAAGSTGNSGSNSRTSAVQSFATAACAQLATVCCNPSFCAPTTLCTTDPSVTLTPEVAGGTWTPVAGLNTTTGVFDPAVAGPGTFTITYTLACGSQSATITVSACAAMTVCVELNGSLTVSGGTGPFNWQNQQTTTPCIGGFSNFCGLFTAAGAPVTNWVTFATGTNIPAPAGYPIQIVDANNTILSIPNLASIPACATSCPTLTITPASQVNVACFGQLTGSFSATTAGGASPYDYVLMNGATTVSTFNNIAGSQAFTGLGAGTYTLNVTDNNNCTGTATITITQPGSAVSGAIGSQTNVLCFGNATGAATINGAGGTGALGYSWNTIPVQTGATASGLTAGTYTCTITDANSCTSTVNVTITQPASAVSVSLGSSTNATCGSNNGAATVNGSGGTGAITYSWNTIPVQTGATATGLGAGTYTVTATDANSCTSTLNVTINAAGAPSGSVASQTNVLCFGNTTGAATINGSGGTGALTYSWNTIPVQTGATATGLPAGTYTCTITDASSCTATVNITITQPASAVSVSLGSSTNATCGSNNGAATVNGSGGTGTITYSWNTIPVQTGATATGLGAGTYTVTATDANSCTSTLNVTINAAGAPTGSVASQTNVLCFGNTTGAATINGSGGTGALTYSWNTTPVQTSATATGLPAGTYTCTITDASSCTATVNVTITQPASAVGVSLSSSTNASCGISNGSATVSGSGGTGAITYSWNTIPVQTGTTATGLPAGGYIVTATDANGCASTLNVNINNVGGPSVSLTSSTQTGCSTSTGTATVNGTGGTGALSYSWNTIPAQTGATATGLATGTYTVTVTDANSCSATLNVTITATTPPSVSLSSSTPSGCATSTGAATVNGTGGTGALTYSWNTLPAQTGATATGLAAGTYTVTVTDANNCSSTLNVTIGTSGGPSVTLGSQTNVLCNGGSTGTATANGTGGTGALTYSWNTSPAQTGATATALPAGTYTVTVTDANSCTSTLNVTITQPTPVAVSNAVTNANCAASDGTITATVSGGTGPYSYAWTSGGSTATETGLAPGNYSVTVTDANGCTQTQTSTVGAAGTANINVSPSVNIALGSSTTLIASGGIFYTWTPPTGLSCTNCSSPTASPTVTTTYYVTGTDANGCVGVDSVTVIIDMPCGELFLPNAFSPNGDGSNDEWQLYGNCIVTMEIRIFNRWGELVYHSTNPTDIWDGLIKGKMAEAAVFYYVFEATTTDGEEHKMNGTITLMK